MKNTKIFFLQFCLSLFLLLPNFIFAQGIEIESGASITITGAATIEISAGNFVNNGTYTKGTETVTFSGILADTISGSSNTVFNNLVITNTGGTNILAGTAVTATNLTTTGGTLIVNSDASANGSLIVEGSSTGNVTYNRHLTASKWHLISAPFSETVTDFISVNADSIETKPSDASVYGLAHYDNSIPNWSFYTTGGTSDVFTPGKGYEVMRKTTDGMVTFTGTLATDNVGIEITAPISGNPWNLVGNPYPSALCANNDATTATSATENLIFTNTAALGDGAFQAVYVWDANAATPAYITVNHSISATYIAPGQAFFVNSLNESGSSFQFTEAMQTHQTGDIFKSGEIENPVIKLFAEASQGTSSTNIKYIDNTTTGLDPGYDAGRFSGGNNSFAIYTHLVGDATNLVDFDIQCLPANEYNHIIPVGLNAPENSEVIFRAETINLPIDVPVYLEDRENGIFTALNEPGSFYQANIAGKSEGVGRFFLTTQKSATTNIGTLINESDITIIPRPEQQLIRVIGKVGNNAQLEVYDLVGRKLMQRNLGETEINEVEMNGLNSGIYIIHINSSIQNISKRISWVH